MRLGSRRMLCAVGAVTLVWLIGVVLAASEPVVAAGASGAAIPSRVGSHSWALQGGQPAAPKKVLLAEEVFKNVQALKGVSVDDFMATMGLMSAALGFDCDTCHEKAGTDQVKWEDDGPNKRTARRMVLMVQTINRDNFGGRQVVTCWTCHRGRDFPYVTPPLDTWYGEPPSDFDDVFVPVPGSGGPTAVQVLDESLQALGGVQKLNAITSYVAKGKSSFYRGFGGGAEFEIAAQAPDKRATHIVFPDDPGRGNSTRTYNGQVGWMTNVLAVVRKYELTGGELQGARLDALLSFPAQVKTALTNLRVGPVTDINDQNVQIVQGNGPGNILVTLYFAEDTGLLVRLVRYSPSPIGRLPTQVDYSDYRDVAGVKMPFRYVFSWLDGRDTFEVANVQTNVRIDPATFGEPQAAQ